MPLNMNTIGTGIGIGGESSGDGRSQLIAPSSIEAKDYGNIASYYIKDYSAILPNTNKYCKKVNLPEGLSRMIWFKNELYGVRITNSTYVSSVPGYVCTFVLSKLTLKGSTLTATDLYTYQYLGGMNYRWYSNMVIPGSKYLYFIEYKSISYTYQGNSRNAMAYVFSRFDGNTVEQVNIMASNDGNVLTDSSWLKDTGYVYGISYFNMLDPQEETFLIGVYRTAVIVNMSKSKPTVTKITGRINVTEYGDKRLDKYDWIIGTIDSTEVYLCNSYIIGNTGIAVIEGKVLTFTVKISGSTITFSNLAVATSNGRTPFLCASEYGNCMLGYGGGGSLYAYASYSDFFTMNPTTGNGEYHHCVSSNSYTFTTLSPDGGATGFGCGTAVDRSRNIIYHINWLNGSGQYYMVGGCYEPIILEYLADNRDSGPHSDISFNADTGDVVYCSSTITGYKLASASSYISTSTKKLKIPIDGSVIVTSNHGESGYHSTWIIMDSDNNIKYIKYSVLSSTLIHGYFLRGMMINQTQITSDGEQDVTVSDISTNGLYISMKEV